MPFCGNCGHPLKETDFTCPICGAAQPNTAIPEPDAIPVPEEETISEIPTTETTSETDTTSTEPSASTSYIPPVPPEQSAYNETSSYNPIPNEVPPQQFHTTQNDSAKQNSYDTNSSYQQSQTNYNAIPPTYQGTSYSTPNSPLTNQSNGFGVASLVLGICSIAICCCYGFGLLPAIIGLILGIVQNKKYSNGIAISGIVLCIVGILLNVVWLIYMILILSASESGVWNEFFEEFSREFSDEFSENYDYYNNSTL
ncbi:MAG: DUF4190 domain-containing protein [Oscillospiraceae bacterium]|nr:DUF4190 domain-containing protein [Oscillospiraceae bacterium]